MRSSRPHGGGHRPTLDEVSANLRAGADWASRRDLPDVDGWADFNAAPELVHQRLISRLQEGRCPPSPTRSRFQRLARARSARWRGSTRMTISTSGSWSDVLRSKSKRRSDRTCSAIGLRDDPPAWSVRDVRVAFRLRRERARELFAEAGCNAIAVADLRHYYPSVEPEVAMNALHQANSPHGAVILIGDLLHDLEQMGAPRGLPIGPEASGVLGNIVLLGLDEAISCRVRGHIRYTDDSWLFLRSESEWPEVREVYTTSAADLGLEVNTSKVAVHPKGSDAAEHIIQHGQISYLTSPAARYRTPQRSADELREELKRDEPDWVLVKFHLGSLRYTQSPRALPILCEQPRLLQEIPQSVGHYLSAVVGCPQNRQQVDRDWLVEQATARPTARSLAGQLQLCRVASQLRLGKDHGNRLVGLAADSSLRRHAPLQAWAAKAWGSSKAHAPARAVEYACHFGDFSVRRAFTLTVSPNASTSAKRSCWRRKLQSVDPDLEPTLARLD